MADNEETQAEELDNITAATGQTDDQQEADETLTGDEANDVSEELSEGERAGIRAAEALKKTLENPDTLSPHVQRAVQRTEEETKRVEKAIKGTKSNPAWFVPLFSFFLVLGLVWVIVYYLPGDYPIPNIDWWNLVIGFAIMMVGFIMMMWWR